MRQTAYLDRADRLRREILHKRRYALQQVRTCRAAARVEPVGSFYKGILVGRAIAHRGWADMLRFMLAGDDLR